MAHEGIQDLVSSLKRGEITRRQFMQRAAALGLSARALGAMGGAAGLGLGGASLAAAQDDSGLLTTNNEQQNTWIRNFNPLLPENASSRWPTLFGIYEPLFVWNTIKAEPVPWLAESWEFSEDNLQLTFHLRGGGGASGEAGGATPVSATPVAEASPVTGGGGVLWSDGEPFTADDVAFTWNLMKDNEALPGNGARVALPFLDSIDATDEHTVVFTFKEVYTIGLYDIANQVIVPEHIWKDVDDPVTYANEDPVGTGPFTEVARFEAQIFELHANPNYWQEGKPYIKGLRMPAYPDNDSINLATINGEVDWTANFIADIENTFVAKDPEHFHFWFPPTGATVHLYLNTTVKPFDNADVRKAISMAINREQIVNVAMFDYTHPADTTGLSDAFESQKDEEAKNAGWATYDKDKANEMLDAAGLAMDGDVRKMEDGTPLEFDLNVVSGWSDWVQSCDIMSRNLADVGIKATVKPYDQTTWQTRVQNGDFTMSIGWSSQGATIFNFYRGVMSGITWNPIGTSSGENWHRFKSDEVDKMLDEFAATSDLDKQQEISVQLQRFYAEHAPAIPLFPGPQWGEFNTTRFTGFPSEDDPYSLLSTYATERGIVMTTIKPVGS